jgi:hypothetical protein
VDILEDQVRFGIFFRDASSAPAVANSPAG